MVIFLAVRFFDSNKALFSADRWDEEGSEEYNCIINVAADLKML